MRYLLPFFLMAMALPGLARPLSEVPSPRPSGWVSDTVNLLDTPTLQSLNRRLEDFHREQGSEMAVVVVDSADGMSSKAYAHELFNRWGVGRKGYNDGVLFVVFKNDRRMEVEVGEGCRRQMPDQKTLQILQTSVVPQFKAGHPSEGVLAGVRDMCSVLGAVPPLNPNVRLEDPTHSLKAGDLRRLVPVFEKLRSQGLYALIRIEPKRAKVGDGARALQAKQPYPLRTVVFLGEAQKGTFACCVGADMKPQKPQLGKRIGQEAWVVPIERCLNKVEARVVPPAPVAARPAPRHSNPPVPQTDTSFLWTGGLAVLGLGGSVWMVARRHAPRKCPNCQEQMRKLSESEEDEFLDAGQQAEERAGSVDYDVWICHACDVTNIQRYGAWLTSMKTCSSCAYKTCESSRTTLESATEYSEGRGRTDYYCRHCGYKHFDYYTISRLASSSSDSSSSDSSSSSSGFSGGSSDGGGAGASW